MKYYLIPGGNFDRVGRAEEVPPGRQELSPEEAALVYREQLSWEIGSGYLDPDTDVEREVSSFLS